MYGSANPAFAVRYDGFVLGQDSEVLDGDAGLRDRRRPRERRRVLPGPRGRAVLGQLRDQLRRRQPVGDGEGADDHRRRRPRHRGEGRLHQGVRVGQPGLQRALRRVRARPGRRLSWPGRRRTPPPRPPRATSGRTRSASRRLSSDNYAITYAAGSLSVTAKALTVTVDADPVTEAKDAFTKVYGSDNPAFSVRYDGFVLGQGAGALSGRRRTPPPRPPRATSGPTRSAWTGCPRTTTRSATSPAACR